MSIPKRVFLEIVEISCEYGRLDEIDCQNRKPYEYARMKKIMERLWHIEQEYVQDGVKEQLIT